MRSEESRAGIAENKRSHAPGANRDSSTMTMRALVDVGESIAYSVHAIYSPVRLYLCVAMEVKPEALAAQQAADKKMAIAKIGAALMGGAGVVVGIALKLFGGGKGK